jgi:hypothetical protein
MKPEEFETFMTVHGHNNFRVYKAFEEGDGGDKYVTVNEVIAYAIRDAYEDAARIGYGIMRDFWSEQEAARFRDEFAIRTSRCHPRQSK